MKTSSIVCLFAVLSSLGHAAPNAPSIKEASPQNSPVAAQTALKADPEIVAGKLDNGLSYYIRPNAEPKGRLSIRLRVATGSLNEVEENQGIAHFIEHLVFNGSKHFKRGELMPAMQRHGLGLGGDANAYTSFDETVYMLDLPSLDEKTTDLAFTIMRDFGDGALLEESAINAERGIIESEFKVRDSAEYRSMKELLAFLAPDTKVPFRMPIGTLDFIRNGQRDLFLDYYQTQYIPSRMQLVLVGDISVEQGKAWIDKYFGDMQGKEYAFKADWGKVNPADKQQAKWMYNDELSSTKIGICNVKPYVKKADTEAQRIEDLPLQVAMQMLNTRFSRMAQKADCPFVNASISRDDFCQLVDIVSVDATTTAEQWQKAMAAIEQETRRAAEFGFNEDELAEAVKDNINSAEVYQKTWKTIKSDDMAMMIVNRISDESAMTAPDEDLRVLKKGLEMIQANPDLCKQALQKVWNPATAQITVNSNVENKDGEKAILDCFKASEQTKVEPIQMEKLAPFAYSNIGEPGKVVATNEVKDMGITQLSLSNGIKVNLKQTEFDKDMIFVNFSIDGGEVTRPIDKQGLERLAEAVMTAGGLEAHSIDDLNRLMAGHSVGVVFGTDSERFNLSGSTTPNDLELQLQLMAAYATHAGYRPEGEILFRRAIPLMYSKMKHNPQGNFMMQGMKYIVNGDKRFTMPTQPEMESLTTADVKSWVDPHLKNGYMEVTIVGDYDAETLIPLLEKTIGAMPQRPGKPAALNREKLAVTLAKSGECKEFDYPSTIDRTLVCSIWKTGDGFDRKRALRVALLQAVLRERLFKGIREKMGETYSPMISLQMSKTYPNLGLLAGICPGVLANKDQVGAAVEEIAGELGKGLIDQDELDRAKKPMLNAFDRDLRSNGYWMGVMGSSQSDPSELEVARTRIQAFKDMTLEEMNNLAKEIFTPENLIRINIIPDIKPDEKEEAQPESQPEAQSEAAAPKAA